MSDQFIGWVLLIWGGVRLACFIAKRITSYLDDRNLPALIGRLLADLIFDGWAVLAGCTLIWRNQ